MMNRRVDALPWMGSPQHLHILKWLQGHERLLSGCSPFCDLLNVQLPLLAEEEEEKKKAVQISIHGPGGEGDDEDDIFDDAESRAYYEQLPDLKSVLPAVLFDDVERHLGLGDARHACPFRRRVERHRHGEHARRVVLVHCVGAGPLRRRRIADRQVMLRVESNPPPRHRRDSSNARTPLATVVADALVDVSLEGVLVIRHFFLRARRAGAVVEVQGHASSRRRRAVLLCCCGRGGGVQNTCSAAELACLLGCEEACVFV